MKPHLLALALVSLLPAAVAAAPPRHAPPHRAPHRVARHAAPPRDVVEYAAPAGTLPAEHLRGGVYDAVLPSGRIVTPVGQSVVTGMNALGVALSPDGRFAIVTNDDEREAQVPSLIDSGATGGFTLAVVDTSTMQVVDHYRSLDDTFWVGVAALADPAQPGRTLVLASGGPTNALYVFDLDGDGHLRPDAKHVIALPSSTDTAFADAGHAFPGTIVVSGDGKRAYVVDEGDDAVTTVDVAARLPAGVPHPVGFFPFGAALAGDRLLVTNEGLMRYATQSPVAASPPFRTPAADVARASALSFLKLTADGDVSALPQDAPPFANAPLPMDPAPDGLRIVGGAHPTSIAVTRDGAYAFVAMTNVDRIATVALGGTPRVVGGTELRLFDKGPYGTQPAALALSKDGARLYVALAGLDAVAVIDAHDPIHLHRLGLIATGWYPTALALSSDDRTLYVVNTKGFGHDAGFTGDPVIAADASAVWSTLQKIDLAGVQLKSTTMMTLANTRRVVATPPRYPHGVTHVVVIEVEGRTFDAMLGDLGADVDGDPRFVTYGENVTPNLHALARRYGLAVNLFADAEESGAGHQFVAGGLATLYSERTLFDKMGRGALVDQNQDPEDYPRSGYIFNALARHRIAFRDYGDLVQLSGYDGDATDAEQGLGGSYALDVPAPAALDGHIDLTYPGWNLRIRDEQRAREFIRDYGTYVARGQQPRYVAIWLPDGRAGSGSGIPPAAEEVADSDRALGTIVQYLSHLPSWRNTALFVVPDDAHGSRDHVDEYRTYAIVAGPYAKRHYLGRRHLSTVSVLKTTEQLLGLGNLSIGDLLATDMADFFTPSGGDAAPYDAIPVPQQGG